MDLERWLIESVAHHRQWEAGFASFERHPSLEISDETFANAFGEFTKRLEGNYPYFHPHYVGQMLKPPHPAATVGYLAAMLINPNNHSADGGPATTEMEIEAVDKLAEMFGLRAHLGHLTSSGTAANLEALYVARQSHPGKGVAYSEDAHYTHERMCGVLGMAGYPVRTDGYGRIDLNAVADLADSGVIGSLVLTAGSTGLGAVDRIDEAIELKRRFGLRLHVDAAYGGFFSILAGERAGQARQLIDPTPWLAIKECDSIVVDPHKHGLQPYGCGAVLFTDPDVARFYLHDSPYTYYTPSEHHLGEISLECSRGGASAAALWLTLRLLPPTPEGLGAPLAAGLRATRKLAAALDDSSAFAVYQRPELDILAFYPRAPGSLTGIDRASGAVLEAGMSAADTPVFLSVLRVSAGEFGRRHPGIDADADGARLLRSVVMKPEVESEVGTIRRRLEELCGRWRDHIDQG